MTAADDHLCITHPVASRAARDLQRLRDEYHAIWQANRTLVEYGLTSGSPETHARLRAINSEAVAIAARLDALGVRDQVAHVGWTIILTSGAAL